MVRGLTHFLFLQEIDMLKSQIKSLALVDLDIEELDRRIELAPAATGGDDWPCSSNCGVNCATVCQEYYICGANVFKQG